MNNASKKELARQLIVQLGKTGKEIAEQLDVSEKTISNWRRDGKWDLLRAAEVSAPLETAKALYRQIQMIVAKADEEQRVLDPKETDQISKLATAIDKTSNRANLGHYVQIMEEFALFIKAHDLALAREVVQYQSTFLNRKADEYK